MWRGMWMDLFAHNNPKLARQKYNLSHLLNLRFTWQLLAPLQPCNTAGARLFWNLRPYLHNSPSGLDVPILLKILVEKSSIFNTTPKRSLGFRGGIFAGWIAWVWDLVGSGPHSSARRVLWCGSRTLWTATSPSCIPPDTQPKNLIEGHRCVH
jgi:hypothetical protein